MNYPESDSTAFLFNLTRKRHFPCIDATRAIYRKSDRGPCFGTTDIESHEPFNARNMWWSYIEKGGYQIKKDAEGRNMLTNLKIEKDWNGHGTYFTITELEVWGLR